MNVPTLGERTRAWEMSTLSINTSHESTQRGMSHECHIIREHALKKNSFLSLCAFKYQ